jgi:hypothetical protein
MGTNAVLLEGVHEQYAAYNSARAMKERQISEFILAYGFLSIASQHHSVVDSKLRPNADTKNTETEYSYTEYGHEIAELQIPVELSVRTINCIAGASSLGYLKRLHYRIDPNLNQKMLRSFWFSLGEKSLS